MISFVVLQTCAEETLAICGVSLESGQQLRIIWFRQTNQCEDVNSGFKGICSLFPDKILPTSRLIRMLVPCCLVTDVIDITAMNGNVYNLRERLQSHTLLEERGRDENKIAGWEKKCGGRLKQGL